MYVRRIIVIMSLVLALGAGIAAIAGPSRASSDSYQLSDYPELKITATGSEFELPTEVAAGRYLVTVDNRGEEGLDTQIILAPEDRTVEEVAQAFADPNEAAAWLYDATWAGGPTVQAGNQGQTIIDLAAGDWAILADGYAPSSLTVSAAAPGSAVPVDPDAAATVELMEYGFAGLSSDIQPGKQAWKVTNNGDQPHFLEVVKAPGPVTFDQVMEALMSMGDPNATPAPGALDPAMIEGVGGIATISPGQTGWYITDLEPGTYIALCFVPDRDSGMPHAMMGMVQVFTVSDATTPTS